MQQTVTPRSDDAPESTSALSYAKLVRTCWRGKWFLILGLTLGLCYGLLFNLGQPPVYQSSTQVLVVKKKQSEALPVPRLDSASYFEDYVAEHIVLIKSPLIVDRAVKLGNLRSLKSFERQEDPTSTIIGSLSVTRDTATNPLQTSHLLKLSYTGDDPEDCRLVLSAVLESYKQFLEETYRSVGDETVTLITDARNVLQKDLARKAKEYQEFRQNAPLLYRGKDGTTINQETLANLQSARSALLLRKARAQGHLQTIENALAKGQRPETLMSLLVDSKFDGGEKRSLAALQKELLPLLVQEKELLRKYGPEHPEVQAIQSKIDLTRELATRPTGAWSQPPRALNDKDNGPFFQSLIEDYLRALRQEIENIQAEETAFTDLAKSLEDEARKLVNYEIQDDAFRSDTLRTQQLYDSILQRLSEVNLIKDMGGFSAQVVFPPDLGVALPTHVATKIVTAMSFGLLAGFCLAFAVNFFDKSFHSPEEIRRRLGLAVVGHIPQLQRDAQPLRVGAAAGPMLDPLLWAHYRPRSRETEAFRGVRTALYFNTHGAGHKVLQITSPDVGDGKTTLAANLAVCIAQSGKKTLLIDADLRKGRLDKVFGLPDHTGLACVLAGQTELAAAIQPTIVPGLFVLVASTAAHNNPAELLTSPRFKETLDQLRAEYDYVLVDTPPLLAVTDASVVAPRVDGVLLVVRTAKKNDGPNAERAMEMLSALGAQVLGVVVNGVDPRGGFGAYAYRAYGYGDGYAAYDNGNGEPKMVVQATNDTVVEPRRPSADLNPKSA